MLSAAVKQIMKILTQLSMMKSSTVMAVLKKMVNIVFTFVI